MNTISAKRVELTKKNFAKFDDKNVKAAFITGSVAKGYADDSSDIDTIINYDKPFTQQGFDKIVLDARRTGGDLYHGTPEEGFAVYYYFEGIKCDFGFGDYRDTERLITEMLEKPELDPVKHLQIHGFIDSIILKGGEWMNKWRTKAMKYPPELAEMTVKHHLKFHPEWVLQKMGVERNDVLFFYETLIESIGNVFGILCGLNKMYHPGKMKGAEFYIEKMNLKPDDFIKRYNSIFRIEHSIAVKELFGLVRDTLTLIENNMPEVSTERARKLIDMKLRKQ